jgi:hypothetical protein
MRATAAAAQSNQIAGVGDHHHQSHLERRGNEAYLPPPVPTDSNNRTSHELGRRTRLREQAEEEQAGWVGKGVTDIVERPLLLVVDLRVPEGLELLHRRRRHLPGRIAFLEGLGFRFHSLSLSPSPPRPLFFSAAQQVLAPRILGRTVIGLAGQDLVPDHRFLFFWTWQIEDGYPQKMHKSYSD